MAQKFGNSPGGKFSMNSKHIACLVLISLVFSFCSKKADIPAPQEPPPPTKVEKPAAEIREPPKPTVEVAKPPKRLDDFDVSNIQKKMADIFFDFDKSELRSDAKTTLNHHVELLKANKGIKVLIEGHCDERGTEEYNLGLGERRANRVREYFISLGISDHRIRTISYGEMRPLSSSHDEAGWAMDRRAHFKLSK
jgi:peptidoglycan-associated lipoprotein